MNILLGRRAPGPEFRESKSYSLALGFLWFAVLAAVVCYSAMYFRSEAVFSRANWGAAMIVGFFLMGSLAIIGLGTLLGVIFSLIAVGSLHGDSRKALAYLLIPFALLGLYAFAIVSYLELDSSRDASILLESRALLLVHMLGLLSVAALSAFWLSRVNVLAAVLAAILFFAWSARFDFVQYWALTTLAEIDRPGWEVTQKEDFEMTMPAWVRWITAAEYRTYRLRANLDAAESVENPHATVAFRPQALGRYGSASTMLAVSLEDGRIATIVVPDFVKVSGPGGVRKRNPERGDVFRSASILKHERLQWVSWMRSDTLNELRCEARGKLPRRCDIVSDPR